MGDALRAVTKAWGPDMPAWVQALADECDALGSQAATGRRLGYSKSTINLVLHNKYGGAIDRVEAVVKELLLTTLIACPGVGQTIRRDRCLLEQTRAANFTSRDIRFFRGCRGGCRHSRVTPS